MPLNPQVQLLLDGLAAAGGPPLDTLPLDEARGLYRGFASMEAKPDVASCEDRAVAGPAGDVPVRVYAPAAAHGAGRGVLVWIHGGGWVLGDVETADPTCRLLANRSGCVVVSVDYRRSPEAKAPEPLEDCLAVVRWVADHADELGVDPSRIAVGGDSAGGNLAALLCLRLRDEGGPAIALQILVYPVTDLTHSSASYDENAEGYFLTRASMVWFIGHHLDGTGIDPKDPRVSPLHADSLEGCRRRW